MSKPVFSDLLTFSVRRNRKSYAMLMLALLPLLILAIVVAELTRTDVGSIVALLILLVWMVFSAAATSQRLNDIGWSGWLGFGLFVLPFGFFFELALLLIPGESGPNKYGPDPLKPPESPESPAA